MSWPSISAVIPTFNHASYVLDAVQSASAQTRSAVEIIVVDDGSSDDTRQRLHAHGSSIGYIFQENRGLPAARNTGIRHAKGEWIALLDADDVWHPEKTEVQLSALKEHPEARLIGSPACVSLPRILENSPAAIELGVLDFLCSTPLSPSSALIRRDCFEQVGYFDETLTSIEDRDMWLRIAARFPAVQVQSPCWWYRRHEGQMSRNAQRMLDNFARVLDKFFDQHGQYKSLRSLAYAFMHLDAANSLFDEGHRGRAIWHLVKSWSLHPHRISDRLRFRRLKLAIKFILGDRGFQRLSGLFKLPVGRNWQGSRTC